MDRKVDRTRREQVQFVAHGKRNDLLEWTSSYDRRGYDLWTRQRDCFGHRTVSMRVSLRNANSSSLCLATERNCWKSATTTHWTLKLNNFQDTTNKPCCSSFIFILICINSAITFSGIDWIHRFLSVESPFSLDAFFRNFAPTFPFQNQFLLWYIDQFECCVLLGRFFSLQINVFIRYRIISCTNRIK